VLVEKPIGGSNTASMQNQVIPVLAQLQLYGTKSSSVDRYRPNNQFL
jgi:hypothetical protein